jgi:hypothetical protein
LRLSNAALCLALVAAAGCLPGDERPEPASLLVSAQPSEATAGGFTTADGWTVRFDRFVTALGDIRLHGAPDGHGGDDDATCNDYAETHYEWLFDMTVAHGVKVGLAHGLGTCSIEFSFRSPSNDTVLGAGATPSDLAFMLERGTDAYADDERASLVVSGTASRGDVEKRFRWVFRHRYELDECPNESGQGYVSVLGMQGGEALTRSIVVRGEELFRAYPDDDAPFLFDRFAQADGGAEDDGDGMITLEELDDVEAPRIRGLGGLSGPSPPGVGGAQGPSMRVLVYILLLPRIARIAGGGMCLAELDNGNW